LTKSNNCKEQKVLFDSETMTGKCLERPQEGKKGDTINT